MALPEPGAVVLQLGGDPVGERHRPGGVPPGDLERPGGGAGLEVGDLDGPHRDRRAAGARHLDVDVPGRDGEHGGDQAQAVGADRERQRLLPGRDRECGHPARVPAADGEAAHHPGAVGVVDGAGGHPRLGLEHGAQAAGGGNVAREQRRRRPGPAVEADDGDPVRGLRPAPALEHRDEDLRAGGRGDARRRRGGRDRCGDADRHRGGLAAAPAQQGAAEDGEEAPGGATSQARARLSHSPGREPEGSAGRPG